MTPVPERLPPPRIPLVSLVEARNFAATKDAKMVNCFVEQTGQQEFAAVKRPGLILNFQGKAGCGQGLINFLDVIYSVSSDYLSINAVSSTTFTQTTATAGWTTRKGTMGVGFNGKLWVMGGVGSDGTTHYNDVYNSQDGINWGLVTANAPWSARAYGSIIIFDDKLWLMGGANSSTNFGDVWYTADGLTWVQANAAAWPGRMAFGLTTLNNKLWIAGGQTFNGSSFFSDVWSSLDGISWSLVTATAQWVSRSRFGFVGFNGKLRILGGGLQPAFNGAGGDLWSSLDGVTWTRDSSNPFGQAATGVFARPALTSIGAEYQLAPNATISGGGGTGALVVPFMYDEEDEGADSGSGIFNTLISPAGTGYTSAPTLTYSLGGGVGASGYTFLSANGATGDKRGMIIQAGNNLYFFAFYNNGAPSNEIWQSVDGTTWTLYQASAAYGARDSTAFFFGNFWVISGASAGAYYQDVWRGALNSSSQLALTPTTSCLPFSFSQTSSTITNPVLFFKTNKDAYTYNPNLATLTKITDVDYPVTTVPGIAYLDAFFFVMDAQGRIWNSAINNPASWSALEFIPMQNEPNGGVALGKVGNYIVALGVWSTQFFWNANIPAPASPLAVNSTLDSLTGCASGDSLVQMRSTIVWIGQNKSEGRGVFMVENLIPVRISTPFVDRILEADNLATVRAFATGAAGHSFYVLTLVNTNITLVYDFSLKVWTFWTSRVTIAAKVVTSLSCDAYGLVTAIANGHGFSDGDPVSISGAANLGYNGAVNINYVDANTFTYRVATALTANPGSAQAAGSNEGYYIGCGSTSFGGDYLVQHETNGGVYQSSMNIFDDFGNPIDVRTKTSNWDGYTGHFKTFPDITLIGDINPSKCLLRYTNDDYNTYSVFRALNMALSRQHLTRNGRARRRAYELRHTANTALRVIALELTPEEGDF